MSDATPLSKEDRLTEAWDHIDAMIAFAYEQGFHEIGYDPAKVIADAIAELQKDADRLNSNTILIHGRDEFGEPQSVHHVGLDLRIAIDAAREQS